MKLDFTINYGSEVSQTIQGELNVKTLAEVKRCLDEAVESLKENRVDSIAMICTLKVEKEEN